MEKEKTKRAGGHFTDGREQEDLIGNEGAGGAAAGKTVYYKNERSKLTISDVADALGVSKTTVSRVISGKGRIGEETRRRVLEYIKTHHYQPNVVAKGLAKSKTYNIAWVIPGDSNVTDLPFFQSCMMGISEVTAAANYDILISMVFENDISQLERIVKNRKVDGVILGRTLVRDERMAYLQSCGIPFVVIGSSLNEHVIQIDNDHIKACSELTATLISQGIRSIALIGGDSGHVVNQSRQKGFELGLLQAKDVLSQIYMDAETDAEVERVVDKCIRDGTECIMCMDDRICSNVLEKLNRDDVSVPQQIKIASFYNSVALARNQPTITSLRYDPKELGVVACQTLFDYIAGKEVPERVLLGYEVFLGGSTE